MLVGISFVGNFAGDIFFIEFDVSLGFIIFQTIVELCKGEGNVGVFNVAYLVVGVLTKQQVLEGVDPLAEVAVVLDVGGFGIVKVRYIAAVDHIAGAGVTLCQRTVKTIGIVELLVNGNVAVLGVDRTIVSSDYVHAGDHHNVTVIHHAVRGLQQGIALVHRLSDAVFLLAGSTFCLVDPVLSHILGGPPQGVGLRLAAQGFDDGHIVGLALVLVLIRVKTHRDKAIGYSSTGGPNKIGGVDHSAPGPGRTCGALAGEIPQAVVQQGIDLGVKKSIFAFYQLQGLVAVFLIDYGIKGSGKVFISQDGI